MFLAGDANHSSSMVSIARSYNNSIFNLDDKTNEIEKNEP